jgi:immune inhibitor A
MKQSRLIAIGVVVLALIACMCVLVSGLFGMRLFFDSYSAGLWGLYTESPPTNTPVVIRPTPESIESGLEVKAEAFIGKETLNTLQTAIVPPNDLRDLAMRLEGKLNIPLTVEQQPINLQLGSKQDFWVSNLDSNENFQISATLEHITDHAYFWVQDGISFEQADLHALMEAFESKILPINRDFFGIEWSPGVDGDPRIYILYAQGLGTNLAGYFSWADEQHPLAHEYSNAHEIIVLNSDNISLFEEFAYAVLAHEYQHMIHWYRDHNEVTWVNEGFSELAVFVNGYEVGSEYSYVLNPDLQLNDWPNNNGWVAPHYGASFLFLTYFLDRFGEETTKELVREAANGLAGIDRVLVSLAAKDPLSGKSINADDVFMDWVVASYLTDENVSDGRYTYSIFPEAPRAVTTETISDCPLEPLVRDVHQYGVDYIRIKCRGDYILHFEGSTQATVIPMDPYSGRYSFWSNKGDEADMTLTRAFDFRNYVGPLTLEYWTWYDLEDDYDYVFLEVSEDGEKWEILVTPSGTGEDPSGNSYGWAYNGESGTWIQESVDLSSYAGKRVHIRFEYVTDAAINGEGMLIDDISIPEIGYFVDFEKGVDEWEGAGWVRIENVIPQTYRLVLITFGDETEVIHIPLSKDVIASIPINFNDGIDEAVLVVSGTTRFTRQKAAYTIEIQP